tara:strand:+ start:4684 stop:5754 length:1071 start_codon:yes stop_codon:yes gene_type:complete
MAYKYKLSEMSKTASEKDAEKELDKPQRGFEVGQVTISDDGTTKSTITDIDDETGAVRWKVEQLPGFDKLYDELDDLVGTAKRVYVKTKDDNKFRQFYDDIRVIRNKVRTHLRNEYPDQYKRITRITEQDDDFKVDVIDLMPSNNIKLRDFIKDSKSFAIAILDIIDEIMSDENASIVAPSNIKQALDALKREAKKEVSKVDEGTCGYDRDENGKKLNGPGGLGEGDTYEKMAAKGKKAGNLKQGTVRKRLNIPKGEKIPLSKITKEISRIKKMDNPSEKNKKYLKALNLAKTLKTTTNVNESQNPGASLGPGPKAGPDGVTDNYYVKGFKYKLVPKTKNGTYVQKGSGLEVKKLF